MDENALDPQEQDKPNPDVLKLLMSGGANTMSGTMQDQPNPAFLALAQKIAGPEISAAPSGDPAWYDQPKSVGNFLTKALPHSAAQAAWNALSIPKGIWDAGKGGLGAIESMAGQSFPDLGIPQGQVPQWQAMKEAAKERYGHPLETMYQDPVGSLIDLSALASGVGGLARSGAGIAERAGAEIPGLARTGEIMGDVSKTINPLELAAKGMNKLTGAGEAATKQVGLGGVGLMTGRGPASEDFWNKSGLMTEVGPNSEPMQRTVAAMRGHISEQDTYNNMEALLDMAKTQRGNEYRSQLAEIAARDPLDMTDTFNRIKNDFYDKLERDYRIRRTGIETPEPAAVAPGQPGYDQYITDYQDYMRSAHPEAFGGEPAPASQPGVDFKGSGIVADDARKDISKMDELLRNWQERYPHPNQMDMDLLKRAVDNFYDPKSQARAVVAGLKDDIRSSLNSDIPGYEKMTSKFNESSERLEALQNEYALNNKNPGVTMRKMANAFNQNNQWRKSVLDDMRAVDPGKTDELMAEMAGHHFSGWIPKGIMGPLSGAGIARAMLRGGIHPANAATLLLTSPRVMGEGMAALQNVIKSRPVQGARAVVGGAMTNPLLQATMGQGLPEGNPQMHIPNPAGAMTAEIPTPENPAFPSNISPVSAEKRIMMADGSVHVYDTRTGAYIRSEK